MFGYVTDESSAVRTDPSMLAFAKPLSVLPSSGLRPRTQYSPDALGLLPAPTDPRLAVVAAPDRDRTGEAERVAAGYGAPAAQIADQGDAFLGNLHAQGWPAQTKTRGPGSGLGLAAFGRGNEGAQRGQVRGGGGRSLRVCGSHGVEHLLALDPHARRGLDAELHHVAAHLDHLDDDVGPERNLFAGLTGENKHRPSLPPDGPATGQR